MYSPKPLLPKDIHNVRIAPAVYLATLQDEFSMERRKIRNLFDLLDHRKFQVGWKNFLLGNDVMFYRKSIIGGCKSIFVLVTLRMGNLIQGHSSFSFKLSNWPLVSTNPGHFNPFNWPHNPEKFVIFSTCKRRPSKSPYKTLPKTHGQNPSNSEKIEGRKWLGVETISIENKHTKYITISIFPFKKNREQSNFQIGSKNT